MTHKSKWLLLAPLGLATIGAGASMVHWAGNLKDQQVPTSQWVAAGTVALVVFNSGICLFGQSIIERVHYELEQKKREDPGLVRDK